MGAARHTLFMQRRTGNAIHYTHAQLAHRPAFQETSKKKVHTMEVTWSIFRPKNV